MTSQVKRKLNQYFRERLGAFPYRRGWMKADCPNCGKHQKWGVNLSTNRTNCFVCEYRLSPIEVVADIENLINSNEVYKFLNVFDGVDFYEEKVEAFELNENATLPESYQNIIRGDSRFAKAARGYVKKRGFDLKKVSMAGWGYCTKGKFMGYLIMPFYRNGQLIYFNARRYMLDGPRFNNPEIEEFGLGKSMLMYNSDSLLLHDRVWVVEGLMNAMTIGENAVSTGGKKFSSYQLNLLIKSQCEKIIIGFDNDGLEDAITLALKLVNYKKVKIIQFKDDRDINDLGFKKVAIMAAKERYLSYNDLIKIKNSI
jgi:DNA primase